MHKKSLLLFKNALKQAFRNKIQLIGLIVLILLSSTIFSLMQTSLTRVANEYQQLVAKSNLHDFVIDLSNTTTKKATPALATNGPNSQESINVEAADVDINAIANSKDNQFSWDRVEGRSLQLDNNGNARILKLLTANPQARIDKLVISTGYNIGDSANPDKKTLPEKQVVINKEFAQKNHLELGDTIRVQKDELGTNLKVTGYDLNDPANAIYNWLKIVGFGVSADFTTPIIDKTTPIPNKEREGLLYVDPAQFGLTKTAKDGNFEWSYDRNKEKITVASDADREIYFAGKWLAHQNNNIGAVSQQLRQKYINTINSDARLAYGLGDSNYQFNSRTSTITMTLAAFKTLLIALLLIVMIITGMTVILVTYKNIDNSSVQIGILKSLGYSNLKILFTSLAYPMIAALLGTILVFLPASGLQLVVVSTFANYFNLDFGSFIFDAIGFIYCLILMFSFLAVIAWIISALTILKNPMTLMKNESVTANSRFSRMVKKSSINRRFLTRFRLSLFTSSIGKMAAVSATMFLGTTLMTTAIIGPKIMYDNKLLSYTGMNYQSVVEYNLPAYNSPFTMYKTYNPTNQDEWKYGEISEDNVTYRRPERSDPTQYINELLANDINSEAYAPMSLSDSATGGLVLDLAANGLTFLHGKMLTKQFLSNLDQSKFNSAQFVQQLVAPNAWPAVLPLYTILTNTDGATFYNNDTYNTLRFFYQNFRSTVAMSLNNDVTTSGTSSTDPYDWSAQQFTKFATETIPEVKNQTITSKDSKINIPAYNNKTAGHGGGEDFTTTVTNFKLTSKDNKYPLRLPNETQLLNKLASDLDPSVRNTWINNVSIWFASLFYGRIGQTVVQGAYSRSPYFIRQNLAQAYLDPHSQFNIAFNVVPFNKETDELGTYFMGIPLQKDGHNLTFNGNNYPLKVYGIQSQAQLGGNNSKMQLFDKNDVALNPLLEEQNNPNITNIVINETIAKQLKLAVNDQFTMATNGNMMKYKNSTTNEYQDFDPSAVDFTGIGNINSNGKDNNVTLVTQETQFNDANSPLHDEGAYVNGGGASPMLKQVAGGNIVNKYDKTPYHFKVVGVYNGYGQPNAYISKTNADKLLHFDNGNSNGHDTRSMLYRLFQQEWQGHGVVNEIDFGQLKNINYDTFRQLPLTSPFVKMFTSEYPIFNFKFSSANDLPDITNSFATSQMYGDYSGLGMNGGVDPEDKNYYQGYGAGSAVNITPQSVHRQLLNQITALVDTVLAAFIIFSLIISFFIILLTSNLVIYENRKTIATMKTLGYSDGKITNIVIGMYLPVIAAMFIIGFPIGWVIVKIIVNFLAAHTTWVLPLFFGWWLPVVVGIVVLGIYAMTFIIDWYAMKNINPIKILNEID